MLVKCSLHGQRQYATEQELLGRRQTEALAWPAYRFPRGTVVFILAKRMIDRMEYGSDPARQYL